MKQPRFLFFSALLTAGLALSLVACKGGGGGPANGLSTKNVITWYIPGDVEGLNPIVTADENANYPENLMFEALSAQNPRTQAFLPSICSLPVESADHLTFTFTMDPSAHWSDGKPVTAKDVVFSYKIIMN